VSWLADALQTECGATPEGLPVACTVLQPIAGGAYADLAWKKVPELMLPQQKEDGRWESGWEHERVAGPVYCTSMAMLALAVQHRGLPIYQR
jgi:hypothetical protein